MIVIETPVLKIKEVFNNSYPFTIMRQEHSYNEKLNMHYHEFIELAYVCSGSGINIVEDKRCPITKGDIFIINENVKHQIIVDNPNTEPLVFYNCLFTPDLIKNVKIDSDLFGKIVSMFVYNSVYSKENSEMPCIMLSDGKENRLEHYFEKMHHEFAIKENGYYDIISLVFCQLLIEIYRLYENQSINNQEGNIKKSHLIQKAIKYLLENYSHKLQMDDLSLHVYLSKSHFSKIFKSATGMSVFEYLQKIRIENAQHLIIDSTETLSSIAEMVGYTDYSFFNRTFKRVTGLSPQEYRTRYKNE